MELISGSLSQILPTVPQRADIQNLQKIKPVEISHILHAQLSETVRNIHTTSTWYTGGFVWSYLSNNSEMKVILHLIFVCIFNNNNNIQFYHNFVMHFWRLQPQCVCFVVLQWKPINNHNIISVSDSTISVQYLISDTSHFKWVFTIYLLSFLQLYYCLFCNVFSLSFNSIISDLIYSNI